MIRIQRRKVYYYLESGSIIDDIDKINDQELMQISLLVVDRVTNQILKCRIHYEHLTDAYMEKVVNESRKTPT